LIVLADFAVNTSGTPASVTPTGFTLWKSDPGTNSARLSLSYKLAAGTESGSLTGMNGNLRNHKIMLVFRGTVAFTSLTASTAVSSGATDADPAAQTFAASGGTAPLVVIGATCVQTGGVMPDFNMSPTQDGLYDNGVDNLKLGYKIYNVSPVDVTLDMGDDGVGNDIMGGYISCA
jgi:hypothetical protein